MAVESSLSLYQLMGAPLQALVDAEAEAAFATAAFIKELGFLRKEGGKHEDDYGDLRMVTFRHDKIDADGTKKAFKVEVPLLSLIPIPALQIKDADLDFFIRIVENPKITQKKEEDKEKEEDPLEETLRRDKRLGAPQRDLKGTIGRAQEGVSRKSSLEMQIKVRIRMEQADVPGGLGKLFNLMAENVSMRALPPEKGGK